MRMERTRENVGSRDASFSEGCLDVDLLSFYIPVLTVVSESALLIAECGSSQA